MALAVAGVEGGGVVGTGRAERVAAQEDVPVSREGEALLRVGVVSDTHGSLDPQLPFLLRGADRILHAGDIGGGFVVEELELVAPLTAVIGNMDAPCGLPERVGMELGGAQVLLTHTGLSGWRLAPALADYLSRRPARVVVFGHTHEPLCEEREGLILFNPGSAGRKRFRQPRCFGWMEVGGEELRFRVVSLEEEGRELLAARFPLSPGVGPR